CASRSRLTPEGVKIQTAFLCFIRLVVCIHLSSVLLYANLPENLNVPLLPQLTPRPSPSPTHPTTPSLPNSPHDPLLFPQFTPRPPPSPIHPMTLPPSPTHPTTPSSFPNAPHNPLRPPPSSHFSRPPKPQRRTGIRSNPTFISWD
ncbi:hypothetical protein Pmani_027399, partial [Petrolisthes manimaculis]